MKPQHQNNTFIDTKQCSLVSLRGKPSAQQSSITIILKKKLLVPLNHIYTKSIYQNNNLEEDILEPEDSIRSSYI
jgi:hypothetical protein